jgi:pyruvate dehydrogenase E1 component
MVEAQEDVFYYITVMNENYAHPAMPDGAEEGIVRGMYRLHTSPGAQVQLLGSGTILREVIAAADMLKNDWGVAADVWSVTSYTELQRDGMRVERRNRLHPESPAEPSYVERCLSPTSGPVIAASDYVRALPDLIRAWVPRRYVVLGTDGYGRSDTRADLRRFFEVDRAHVVVAALRALAEQETVPASTVQAAIERYNIATDTREPWRR